VELEAIIKEHITGFILTGMALTEIRDQRLYRGHYGSFEEYCKQKHGLTRQRCEQIVVSSAAARNVLSITKNIRQPSLPDIVGEVDPVWIINERQARELARLQPDDQARVWRDLLARWQETGRRVTARDVRREVDALLASRLPPSPVFASEGGPAAERQSLDYIKKFNKYAAAISFESDTGWLTTSRDVVLRHLRELIEKVEGNGARQGGGD
jgi:hypothetical protein